MRYIGTMYFLQGTLDNWEQYHLRQAMECGLPIQKDKHLLYLLLTLLILGSILRFMSKMIYSM